MRLVRSSELVGGSKKENKKETTNYELITNNFQSGFSLVETILVIAIAGILVLLLANLPNALGLITKSKNLSLAREIAAKQVEDKRNINYSNLVPDTTTLSPSTESRLSLLPSSSAVVKVEDCDPEQNPLFCPNNEHIKIVSIDIKWKESGKEKSLSLKTFVGEGGLNQ